MLLKGNTYNVIAEAEVMNCNVLTGFIANTHTHTHTHTHTAQCHESGSGEGAWRISQCVAAVHPAVSRRGVELSGLVSLSWRMACKRSQSYPKTGRCDLRILLGGERMVVL